jgi:beta-N-acetylhexosaminidase
MSLEEKIGQMIMPWARVEFMNVGSPAYLQLQDEMQRYHVGGFGVTVFTEGSALIKSEPFEAAAMTNELQRGSKYPLLFAADFERGLSMRLTGATGFPAAMAFGAAGDTSLAREFGRISAREARAVGIRWNWFPVADVNSNPANPIINTRSFSEDPEQVGAMISAYIEGARQEGLLTTAKHFPGHGDTATDSHVALARSTADVERLDRLELVPFRAAIAAHVDSVMMAHITVPAIEPDPKRPASISYNTVTGLLKEKLGFKGLVVTDALDMGALMSVFSGTPAEISGQEAVEAVQAGNDMVIIPADLQGAYDGLVHAVRSGVLTEKRIDASVLKILRLKALVGLDRDRFVDLAAVSREVGKPENQRLAQGVADRAVTLLSDTHGLLPLSADAKGAATKKQGTGREKLVAVVFTDNARASEGGHAFARELKLRDNSATVIFVDEANVRFMSGEVQAAISGAGKVIAVAEVVPTARRSTVSQPDGTNGLEQSGTGVLMSLLQSVGDKTVFVAFGSPYVGIGLPNIGTYLCTFSNTAESGTALVRALFGEIAIGGHSPVSIPTVAPRGAGMDRPKIGEVHR